jgi:type VI secretion system protein ImpK
LERGAAPAGAGVGDVQEVKFALVAFLDETILDPETDFPLRTQWEQNPLQLEHFNEHLAGVKFFEKLDRMLLDPERYVDVLEVYYLCLLLGYKGKYTLYLLEEQLQEVTGKVADRLRAAGRLKRNTLSPHWRQTDQPEAPAAPALATWVKVSVPAALMILLAGYIILYRLLSADITRVR